MTIDFLDLEDVTTIHADQLALFGGGDGLRDVGLLESAIAQPQASFGGEYVHEDLFAMAAAYLFHIVQNHPFIDGNKRTGLLAALVFLDDNGISIESHSESLYEMTIAVAEGRMNKSDLIFELRVIAGAR